MDPLAQGSLCQENLPGNEGGHWKAVDQAIPLVVGEQCTEAVSVHGGSSFRSMFDIECPVICFLRVFGTECGSGRATNHAVRLSDPHTLTLGNIKIQVVNNANYYLHLRAPHRPSRWKTQKADNGTEVRMVLRALLQSLHTGTLNLFHPASRS